MTTRKRTYRDGEIITGPVTDIDGNLITTASVQRHLREIYGAPARRNRRGQFKRRGVLAKALRRRA